MQRVKQAISLAVTLMFVFSFFLPVTFASVLSAASTPALTDGKITGHVLASGADPNAIRFNNLEWTGASSVPAGLPNQGNQAQVWQVNREKAHADLLPYDTLEQAQIGARDYAKEQSAYFMPLTVDSDLDPLTSSWTFSRVNTLTRTLATQMTTEDPLQPGQNIVDFYKLDYDASNWVGHAVPTSWQAQGIGADGKPYTGYYDPEYGYDPPYYTNISMPNNITFKGKTWQIFGNVSFPSSPNDFNPVGFYRKWFDVPADWMADKNKVFIQFDGAEAAFYVYVNGKEVGYHTDSKTVGEFDITPFLNSDGKNNLLGVKVFRWADCSWMDDQDWIRLGGIFRGVNLMATPPLHIRDYKIETKFDSTFTDATLKFDVWARNYTTNMDFSGYGVTAQLFDPSGADILKDNTIALEFAGLTADSEVHVAGSIPVVAPHKWFPDDPYLYTLVLSVYDRATGVAVERISQQYGFKEITYRTAADGFDIVRINGQKVIMFGTNRHETTPYGGHYCSRETYETDLAIMKRNNINTIRTCHYPADLYMYYLADKWGIMILDEANQESHANTSGSVTKSNASSLFYMTNDRIQNLVHRDKNRTSVIMWSIGNESGNQADFREMIGNIRPIDNTRPVHYEPFGNSTVSDMARNQDVRSSMYTSVSGYNSNCTASGPASVMLCEFEHAASNAMGNLKEYTDVFRAQPRAIGGCLWDYVDQSVWTKPAAPAPIGKLSGSDTGPSSLTGVVSSADLADPFTTVPDYGRILSPGTVVDYTNTAGPGGTDVINQYIGGNKPFSIEIWVIPTTWKSDGVFVAKGDNTFQIKYRNSQALQFSLYSGSGWNSANSANIPSDFFDGKMKRLVATFDGTVGRLYYNNSGTPIATSGSMSAGLNVTGYPLCVGRDAQGGAGRDSNSYIAGCHIYSRVLTASELTSATRRADDPCADISAIFWADYTKGTYEMEYPPPPPFWDYYGNGCYLGFQTDWGEGQSGDRDNCCNGSITATREEQPEMHDVKKCFQNLNFSATDAQLASRTVNVRNEYYAKNGNEFDYRWILTENGVEIDSGVLTSAPNMPPAQNGMNIWRDLPTVALSIPYELPAKLKANAEYYLEIQASLKTATDWAPAGHIVADEQFKLPAFAAGKAPSVNVKSIGSIDLAEAAGSLTLTGKDFTLEFNKATGLITDFTANGQKLLTEGPRPVFWRARTHGDQNRYAENNWTNVDANLPVPTLSAEPSADGLSVVVNVRYSLTAINANTFVDMKYTVYFNGAVNVYTELRSTDNSRLLRFGADMNMPSEYENIEWLARGPFENFNNRLYSAYVGRYTTTVDENFFAFARPSVCGPRQDTRWMAISAPEKAVGLLIASTGDRLFEANAQRWAWREMAAKHVNLMNPDTGRTVVGVGWGSHGVGCKHSGTLSQYEIYASGTKSYSYTLVPFTVGDVDLQELAETYKMAPEFEFNFTADITPVIVSGYPAYVHTSLTDEGEPVENYTVSLFGKEFTKGIIDLETEDVPSAGIYSASFMVGGELVSMAAITVKELSEDFWEVKMTQPTDDKMVLIFSQDISPGLGGFTVCIGNKSYPCAQTSSGRITVSGYSPSEEDIIVVGGVMFEEYFPSYEFAFTAAYEPISISTEIVEKSGATSVREIYGDESSIAVNARYDVTYPSSPGSSVIIGTGNNSTTSAAMYKWITGVTTSSQVMADLESADGSVQTYAYFDRLGNAKSGTVTPGDYITVTAEDGETTARYNIVNMPITYISTGSAMPSGWPMYFEPVTPTRTGTLSAKTPTYGGGTLDTGGSSQSGAWGGNYLQFTNGVAGNDWVTFLIENIPAGSYKVMFNYKSNYNMTPLRGSVQAFVGDNTSTTALGAAFSQRNSVADDQHTVRYLGDITLSEFGSQAITFKITASGSAVFAGIQLVPID